MSKISHVPVLEKEMLAYLLPQKGEIYVDGTFGCGGYSKAILNAASCYVLGIDRDKEAQEYAQNLEEKYPKRFHFVQGNFRDLKKLIEKENIPSVNGIVLDLGVSSPQLNEGGRGFSFQKEGPLDMRMGSEGLTAEEVLQEASEEKLADIFYYFGEERKARSIARAIVAKRDIGEALKSTTELAALVRKIVKKEGKTDPSTRTFQALRIYVNEELTSLQSLLEDLPEVLAPKAKIIIISFHSLEDRIVKNFFKKITALTKEGTSYFTFLTHKPILPSKEEIQKNPRARSAKLRAVQRTDITIPSSFLESFQKE